MQFRESSLANLSLIDADYGEHMLLQHKTDHPFFLSPTPRSFFLFSLSLSLSLSLLARLISALQSPALINNGAPVPPLPPSSSPLLSSCLLSSLVHSSTYTPTLPPSLF